MKNFFVVCVALFFASCSDMSPKTLKPGPKKATDRPYKITNSFMKDKQFHPQEHLEYSEEGLASWYGPRFHRKKTSTGEIYDQLGLTAAHRTLPLPAIVKVTNLENNKKIVLKVNDRGPFTGDSRIIDLTITAAKELGFHHKGLAKVKVETLVPETLAYYEKGILIGEAKELTRPRILEIQQSLPSPKSYPSKTHKKRKASKVKS